MRGLREPLKARTTSSWLAHTARISGPAARERVKVAALLDACPEAAGLLFTARRLFSTSRRRALELRDRGCTWPGCHQPARACEAHHQDHWEHGGPTDLHNGCLLCDYHHDQAHRQGWRSRLSKANGYVEWQPPRALDPAGRWRQHHRHQIDQIRRR